MSDVFRERRGSIAGGLGGISRDPAASTTTSTATIRVAKKHLRASPDRSVENAVYGHIRAVRALGRTEIFPSEIASSLGLSVQAVMQALTALQNKGVKFGK
jgi:hypothetical protein